MLTGDHWGADETFRARFGGELLPAGGEFGRNSGTVPAVAGTRIMLELPCCEIPGNHERNYTYGWCRIAFYQPASRLPRQEAGPRAPPHTPHPRGSPTFT
jgi:hypothetical protein